MISMELVFVVGIVSIILILSLLSYYSNDGTNPLFKDIIDYNNGKDEITIVVQENTHRMKFNVE